MNGLAAFLGVEGRLQQLDRRLKKQNPEPLADEGRELRRDGGRARRWAGRARPLRPRPDPQLRAAPRAPASRRRWRRCGRRCCSTRSASGGGARLARRARPRGGVLVEGFGPPDPAPVEGGAARSPVVHRAAPPAPARPCGLLRAHPAAGGAARGAGQHDPHLPAAGAARGGGPRRPRLGRRAPPARRSPASSSSCGSWSPARPRSGPMPPGRASWPWCRGWRRAWPPERLLREERLGEDLGGASRRGPGHASPPLGPTDPHAARLARVHGPDLDALARAAVEKDYVAFGFGPWRAG